jgi:hypothetical protein
MILLLRPFGLLDSTVVRCYEFDANKFFATVERKLWQDVVAAGNREMNGLKLSVTGANALQSVPADLGGHTPRISTPPVVERQDATVTAGKTRKNPPETLAAPEKKQKKKANQLAEENVTPTTSAGKAATTTTITTTAPTATIPNDNAAHWADGFESGFDSD